MGLYIILPKMMAMGRDIDCERAENCVTGSQRRFGTCLNGPARLALSSTTVFLSGVLSSLNATSGPRGIALARVSWAAFSLNNLLRFTRRR